jgi:hypothetical protein
MNICIENDIFEELGVIMNFDDQVATWNTETITTRGREKQRYRAL